MIYRSESSSSDNNEPATNVSPIGCHVLIIGDYNYKKCRDYAKRYKGFWKHSVPVIENILLHRVFYDNGCLNDLKKEYEHHKKKHGLPHIIIIIGGNRDIARAAHEQVVVTKLCRMARRMRKDGVYKVTIGSLILCGYEEQFQQFNSKVQNANDSLSKKINSMSGTYFLPLAEKSVNEDKELNTSARLNYEYDPKNERYLSRSGYLTMEKIMFGFLKNKLVPLIKEMKLDYKKNLKNVVEERASIRMQTTRLIKSETKVENLKNSLSELEEGRRVLMDDKRKLEFVLKTTSTKLAKIDSYVSGMKALIDTVQDISSNGT